MKSLLPHLLGCAILAGGILGCGSRTPNEQSVKGQVWYRGGPLPGGMIVFVPDEERGNSGPLIKAEVQADGSFSLGGSVPPGWYRMAIAPPPSSGSTLPTVASPYPTVPSRYRNPQLSGLQGEIKPNAENVLDLQLEDA